MTYLPFIDGLRALAVIGVILFHFDAPYITGGYAGVDVFFVISGFLISGIIAEQMKAGRFSFARFYERRARRILPALFVACALSFAAAWVLLVPEDFRQFAKSLKGVAFFSSNFTFARQAGYFTEISDSKPLLHTWSLAVEEQFYFLLPVLMLFLFRRRAFLKTLYALLAVSFAFSVWQTGSAPQKAFFLPYSRIWELLAGVLLALDWRNIALKPSAARAVATAGSAMIVASYFIFDRHTPFPGFCALLPVAGAVLFIWGNLNARSGCGHLLSSRPAVAAGLVSYGLYLFHWPVMVFMAYALGRPLKMFESAAGIALTVALSIVSYFVVEKPVREGKFLASRRAAYAASALVIAVMAAGGLSGSVTNGFPSRFTGAVLDYAAGTKDRDHRWVETCSNAAPDTPACRLGVERAVPDFVLWGDSHAGALRPAVDAMAKDYNLSGIIIADSACPPLLDIAMDDIFYPKASRCGNNNAQALRYILDNHVRHVLMVARWNMYAQGYEQGSVETERPPTLAYKNMVGEQAFAAAFGDTVARLKKEGVGITVFKQAPSQLIDVPSALARAALFGRDVQMLERPLSAILQHRAPTENIFSPFAQDALFIDPVPALCPLTCHLVAGGKPLYSDNDHLSVTGALHIRRVLFPFFNAIQKTENTVRP
jgi:peptidoglycan/LPS O-acetylase OafA/YrhL